MNKLSFLETIKADNGVILHLPYHQHRLESTLQAHNIKRRYDLGSLLSPPNGLQRCRAVYDQHHIQITYHSYKPRTFRSLLAVEVEKIDYGYKYADRQQLDALFAQRAGHDDIAIIQHGLITDTTIANLAFFNGERWLTPARPLLYGTTRQRLIDEGKLIEKPIYTEELAHYDKVALMNAMTGFIEVRDGIIFTKEGSS